MQLDDTGLRLGNSHPVEDRQQLRMIVATICVGDVLREARVKASSALTQL